MVPWGPLADMRALLGHVPARRRRLDTRRHATKCLNEPARGGSVDDAVIALRLVLMLEHVPCVPQRLIAASHRPVSRGNGRLLHL